MKAKEKVDRKSIVLTYYGRGKCACVKCGLDNIHALSIDHIDGHGSEQRREGNLKYSAVFYKWLMDNGYPEGYQTLCMSCQFIKRFENNEHNYKGTAQHKEKMIMRGRHSVMIGIRVSEAVNTILTEMADKKEMTVSSFVKGKVEEFARLASQSVNTMKDEYVVVGGVKLRKVT